VRIAVLGAGAWGSALAISLSAHHDVALWTRDRGDAEALQRQRSSPYLPQCPFPAALRIEPGLESAVAGADLIIVATSTAGLRPVTEAVARIDASPRLLWACKGFETGSQRLPHEIVGETLPGARHVGALSGPSFALEVARGLPTALVVAAGAADFAACVVAALNTPRLRLYSSGDVTGVELGGAVKNVIAIAAGIADGLELGRNARAALITRGLAEITRLGLAMGGQAETFAGLAGLGDLVLTCTGELSRNREVGLRLAAGKALDAILQELGHVAEGVHSARSAFGQAQAHHVDMPITAAVHAVLFEGRPTRAVVEGLLARDPKPEKA
jgi:glycerol-3-phosphate dehydrogenase (NAD(P)+)